jgi:hypothetical protein
MLSDIFMKESGELRTCLVRDYTDFSDIMR